MHDLHPHAQLQRSWVRDRRRVLRKVLHVEDALEVREHCDHVVQLWVPLGELWLEVKLARLVQHVHPCGEKESVWQLHTHSRLLIACGSYLGEDVRMKDVGVEHNARVRPWAVVAAHWTNTS